MSFIVFIYKEQFVVTVFEDIIIMIINIYLYLICIKWIFRFKIISKGYGIVIK